MLGFVFILASVTLQAFALSRVSFQFSSGEIMTGKNHEHAHV